MLYGIKPCDKQWPGTPLVFADALFPFGNANRPVECGLCWSWNSVH